MGPGLETVLIARLQDNYTPKSILEAGESQYGVMATSIESDEMARDAYLALLTVKGMTPESFAAGTTPGGYPLDALSPKGVPFWKVMSPEHYAVYHTDEDIKAAAEEIATDPVNSLASKVMLQWRLDPTKQEDVDYFISSQQKLANVRSAAFVPYYDATGKPTSLAKTLNIPPLPERQALLKEIAYRKPKVSDKDAQWVQKAMRRINGE